MSKKAKTILLIIFFVAVLGGAAGIYSYLSKSYSPENPQAARGSSGGSEISQDSSSSGSETSQDSSSDGSETPDSDSPEETGNGTPAPTSTPIPVPDFTITDAQGQELPFSTFQGKPTVVNFWTPWCPYCKDEMPYFQAAYDTYQEELNVVMMDVPDSRNTAQDAIDMVQEAGYTFPLYLDVNAESLITFGVYSYPQTFFFNSQGEFVGRISGAVSSQEVLFQFIDQLLSLEEGTLF